MATAGEAVHGLKRRRMMHLALDYVMRHRLADSPCRFDVVSIHVDDGRPVVEVFQNAFDMSWLTRTVGIASAAPLIGAYRLRM